MVSRADSRTQLFNFTQAGKVACPFPISSDFLTNHQKWQISQHLDVDEGKPTFHLRDPHGISYTIQKFVFEDLDLNFKKILDQIDSTEEKQKFIHQYLQKRLSQAAPYQVHIERYEHQIFIRFGEDGLKGGMQGNEDDKSSLGKTGAFILSTVQIGVGILCSARFGQSGKFLGGVLISSGLSSGAYAYQQDEKDFKDNNYKKLWIYGAISGGISGSLGLVSGWIASGGDAMLKATSQALGGALGGGLGNATGAAVSELYAQGKWPEPEEIREKAIVGIIGSGAGVATGMGVHEYIGQLTENTGVALHALKKAAEGGLSAAGSKIATNLYEHKKNVGEEVLQYAILGGLISGSIAGLEQSQKLQEYHQTKQKAEQTQKELQEAQAEKVKSESLLETLEKMLRQSEQTLAEKQKQFAHLQKDLQEKQLKQQETQKQTVQSEQEIREAQKVAVIAEEQLRTVRQEMAEAQQQFEKNQQSVNDAKTAALLAGEQTCASEQTATQAKHNYEKFVAGIDKDIRRHLKDGYKAKVNGRYTKNMEKILKEYLEGGKIEWKRGQNRFLGHRETIKTKPTKLLTQYQEAQTRAQQAQQKMGELQSSIEQKQAELKIAQEKLEQYQHKIDQTKGDLKVAQELQLKQMDLKRAQDQLMSYQQEVNSAHQEMHDIRECIEAVQEQASQSQMKISEVKVKLQEALSKENNLVVISREQQMEFNKTYQSYLKLFQQQAPHGILGEALRSVPVSYIEGDCTLQELIPHIVLVHALKENVLEHYSPFDWTRCEDQPYKSLCCIKTVMTPQGVVGHHLQMQNREFQGKLEERPHMHWSWNQLVQPNGDIQRDGRPLNSWEDTQVAILEPLSAFENGIYYKPFGVAPYDTFTFHSHHLSNQSILLIPESIFKEANAYLAEFPGHILIFKGDMRSAIIDALHSHYPQTWHICDEKGKLTGKKMKYSQGGYDHKTCLRTTDGRVIVLIEEKGFDSESEHKSKAIKEYHEERRFIGLHINSVTYLIEKTGNGYFNKLKEFKKNHSIVKNNPIFAGNIKDVDALQKLGVLAALQFYQKGLQHNSQTGIVEVANYIMNEAVYADLVSLFYQMYPTSEFNLSLLDLKMIFSSCNVYLINLIDNISLSVKSEEEEQKLKAFELFEKYCLMLKENLSNIQMAKQEALKLTSVEKLEENTPLKDQPLCLLVGQEEWQAIEVPTESIEFDLGKNWPSSNTDPMSDYVYKVLRTLPANIEDLQQLYYQLSSFKSGLLSSGSRKEQYRLNIICSLIRWALQEKFYLESIKESHNSILASKLSKQSGWLGKYGLETEDFTRIIGDCLFDNVAAQLSEDEVTSSKLRQDVVQFMRKQGEKYSTQIDYKESHLNVGEARVAVLFEDWSQYLERMNTSQVWATELEIEALAAMINCPIILMEKRFNPKIYNPEGKGTPIFLHHLRGNHFESCIPFKGLTIQDVYHFIKRQNY